MKILVVNVNTSTSMTDVIGQAARHIQTVPMRLISICRVVSSEVISSNGAAIEMPALLIRMSILPNCEIVASTTAWICSGLSYRQT